MAYRYHTHALHSRHHHQREHGRRPALTDTESQVLRALYPGVTDAALPTIKWAIIRLQANYRGVSSRRNPLPQTSSWGMIFGKLDIVKRRQRGCKGDHPESIGKRLFAGRIRQRLCGISHGVRVARVQGHDRGKLLQLRQMR